MRGIPLLTLALGVFVAACGGASIATPTAEPEATATKTPTKTPSPTATPSPTPVPVYGPDPEGYPEDINPLTGLPVDDPAILERRPALVKVSNESPEVRPQSGLSFADHVWEYQMEGWGQTRFTAVYYSQSPERVGSVRSVRLIDTGVLIPMYDAILAYSGSSMGMTTELKNTYWERVFREELDRTHLVRIRDIPVEGTDYYHALFAVPEDLWEYADERGVGKPERRPEGLVFSPQVPPGGEPTGEAVVDFPGSGPLHRWTYDAMSERWLSSTEDQKALAEESPDIDLLTGEQLAFDNVVILYAEHYLADFIEDVPSGLLSVGVILEGEGDAILLRDGQRYEVTWRREGDDMVQFFDADDGLIPFKPGTTWFSVTVTGEFEEYQAAVDFKP